MSKVVLPLVLLSSVFFDGLFYSAHAQCAPEDKIYIDPRLVPKPPNISPENMMGIMANRFLSPEAKAQMLQQYQQQGQPIVVPYGTGKVLVHPTNPCIQQYIPDKQNHHSCWCCRHLTNRHQRECLFCPNANASAC
jgi:hypothetical protein